jgi:hypothetical protein
MNTLLKATAVVALAFCTAAVFGWALSSRNGGDAAHAGGAVNNVIAIGQMDRSRLYLIDTTRHTILVYEAVHGETGFELVAGRQYEADMHLVTKRNALEYRTNGYTVPAVHKAVDEMLRNGK